MNRSESGAELVAAWRRAADDAAIAADLEAIFAAAAEAIAARGPACWASGRCCNFEAYGHRLYVTGLETAWVVARAERRDASTAPVRSTAAIATSVPLPQLSAATLSDARARGGCPFQTSNLCGVHEIKPLACRVYFCDRSAQEWQQELLEALLGQLRALHDRHGVPYRYLEWREALGMFAR